MDESGVGGGDNEDEGEEEDIVYHSPESNNQQSSHYRAGAGAGEVHKYKPVRRGQPGVVRKKPPVKGKSIVEELAKYDMHGRPKPVKKKMRHESTYDNAGHIIRPDHISNRSKNHPAAEPAARRNNGYERQHPTSNNTNNNGNNINERRNRKPGARAAAGGAGGGMPSPHRSVSVPVIRIVKNRGGQGMPIATGHKKNIKSPFLGTYPINVI